MIFRALAFGLALLASSNPAFADKPDPGEPLLGSFIEDFAYARDRIAQNSTGLSISCDHEPCTLREDLDGDGQRDLVAQVIDANGQPGLAVLMTGGPALLMAAGLGPALVQSALDDVAAATSAGPWRVVTAADLEAPPPNVHGGVLIEDVLVAPVGGALIVFPNMSEATP